MTSSEGFTADPITREKLHVIEHAIRVRMAPREATGACAPRSDTKPLTPVRDLARWLWVDDCIREVLPASVLQKQRLLIIGGSGMGKTLLTRQLVVLACDAQRHFPKGAPLLLPIRVPLIDIATLCEKREEESPVDGDVFEDYIEA